MDHPLIEEKNKSLRQRVTTLLRNAYSVKRGGNIVFVCGGNGAEHMRTKFKAYCVANCPEFEIFFPEYAMNDYFSHGEIEPFDIADFEELIGDLSHAIVIFPEAPGSYAEVGYFSAIPAIAIKTVLALDAKWQAIDSFISMGPAKKINEHSGYHGIIQTPYENPSFSDVIGRVKRFHLSKTRKRLVIDAFSDLTSYELICVVFNCFRLLKLATIEDVMFMCTALFKSQFSRQKVRKIASILVGAKYIEQIGEFGHYYVIGNKEPLVKIMGDNAGEEVRAQLELASIFDESPELSQMLGELNNVA